MLSKALERLQAGQVAVVRFGDEVELLKPFDKPYNADMGAEVRCGAYLLTYCCWRLLVAEFSHIGLEALSLAHAMHRRC